MQECFDLLGESSHLEPAVPVAMHLRQAGLVVDGQRVKVITDTPPPVRQAGPGAGRGLMLDGVQVIVDSAPPVR